MRKILHGKIDPGKAEPKYEQVKLILLDYIARMPPGQDYLPYEQIISKELNVGQITVRRALLELRRDGIIETMRNRGSKVLRQKTENGGLEKKELPSIKGETIGALVPNYDPEAISGHQPWQISHAFERLAAKDGCRVEFFNLRETQWQNPESLSAAVLSRNIRWIYLYSHVSLNMEGIIRSLNMKDIKVTVFIDSLFRDNLPMLRIAAGVDWVSMNYQEAFHKVLHEHFTDREEIIYVADKSHLDWAGERMKATELFCRQQNIRYLCVTGKLGDKVIDKDAVESKLDFTKKQLFIGANDQTALAIQDILDKQPGRAGHDIHLMGFDNIESARERKISSFDRNFQGVAESLLFLCKQFFKNPEARTLSCGQFVYPVFIRRESGK